MNSDPWGGSEEQWFSFAQSLIQQGFQVSVACHYWEGKIERLQPLKDAGATFYFLRGRTETKNLYGKWVLKKQLNKIPFNTFQWVFVNQGGWKDIAHRPFNQLYKKLTSFIISFHNYNESSKLSLRKKRIMQAWVSKAVYNISDAKKVFEVLENQYHLDIPAQIVYPNPISFQIPAQAPPLPPVQNGNFQWCMLAALYTDRKAQDILIQTLSSPKWKERNWQLNLYGAGKDAAMLQELILQNHLDEKIFLKGHTNNVQATLALHHLVLQCTRIDAMPISISEALAMARPCVVTNVGDMPLWVQNGINGFVCASATPEAIDIGLEECWQKRNEWEEMGKRSFAIFKEKYPQPYSKSFMEFVNR